jgi:hypothetical protein
VNDAACESHKKMKTGYSLLLGEYVGAERLSYEDCKAFQIVCPSCKEPIFKVNREVVTAPVQYLSHYEKDKSFIAECELRVDALTKEEITRSNNLSRGQRLQYFLSVLQEAIPSVLYPQDDVSHSKIAKLTHLLSRSKALKRYRELLFTYERKAFANISDTDLAEQMSGYVDDVREVNQGEFFSTSFALETQKRIACDMWRHVLSAKAKESYFILFSHGYYSLMYRLKLASGERALFEYERVMYSAMEKLIDTSVNKGKMIIQSLINYPIGQPYAMEGSNLFNKMSSEIAHEMFGILLVLPYFEMLKTSISEAPLMKS